MLVLSRKKNEQIVIDENVVVTVVQIRGDKVSVGIEAPKDIPVHRKEVHEAIKREQAQKKASEEGLRQRPVLLALLLPLIPHLPAPAGFPFPGVYTA